MFNYLAYGLSFRSAWNFQSLSVQSPRHETSLEIEVIAEGLDRETLHLQIHRHLDTITMEVPDVGRYTYHHNEGRVEVQFFLNTSRDKIETSILNQAIPFVLATQGEIVLHACALASTRGAFLFLGRTGSGKSNLALAAYQKGWEILADDFVRLNFEGQQAVFSSYPEIRISPTDIQRHALDASVASDMPKGRLHLMGTGFQATRQRPISKIFAIKNSPQVEPNAFAALMDNCLFYPTVDRSLDSKRFEHLASLATNVPIEFIPSPAGLGLAPQWLDVNF